MDLKASQKAYGLTTLQHEHIKIDGHRITIKFIAKEGVPAHYEVVDKTLAGWLKERKAKTTAGEQLFSDVSADKLNRYLGKISNKAYTIKDYRTYHGTRVAFGELNKYSGMVLTDKEKKELIKKVTEKVARVLANTPAMAKKSYIDPMVWEIIGGL